MFVIKPRTIERPLILTGRGLTHATFYSDSCVAGRAEVGKRSQISICLLHKTPDASVVVESWLDDSSVVVIGCFSHETHLPNQKIKVYTVRRRRPVVMKVNDEMRALAAFLNAMSILCGCKIVQTVKKEWNVLKRRVKSISEIGHLLHDLKGLQPSIVLPGIKLHRAKRDDMKTCDDDSFERFVQSGYLWIFCLQ